MKLSELLLAIRDIAKEKGLSIPYIVGGLTRDRLLNKIKEINDVDITTGDSGVFSLSVEFAERLGNQARYERFSDNHSTIRIASLKLDFSSNFQIPGVVDILKKAGILKPTEMQKELYSRDFTCNAALMTLDLNKIIDPTGLSVKDIKDRIIRTCLAPEITLGYDNKRIIRIVYMAAKLDFDVEPEIIEWVKKNPQLVSNVRDQYLIKKLNKSIKYNKDKTVEMLDKMNLWQYIPPIKELVPYMGIR